MKRGSSTPVRVEPGGYVVPEDKIRVRCGRLWTLLRDAVSLDAEAQVLDNSRAATPFRRVARLSAGRLAGSTDRPPWTPRELRVLG